MEDSMFCLDSRQRGNQGRVLHCRGWHSHRPRVSVFSQAQPRLKLTHAPHWRGGRMGADILKAVQNWKVLINPGIADAAMGCWLPNPGVIHSQSFLSRLLSVKTGERKADICLSACPWLGDVRALAILSQLRAINKQLRMARNTYG